MANKDPWLGIVWKVYAAQGLDGVYLKPTAQQGVFTLTAVADAAGETAYYTVQFAAGAMPDCWQGLLLYPRGDLPSVVPSPPLPPWTQSGDPAWLAAADAVRKGLNVEMARLVGDLNPDGNIRGLTLVCVPNATTSGTPLLVARLISATPSGGGTAQPMEDTTGGAHGDN